MRNILSTPPKIILVKRKRERDLEMKGEIFEKSTVWNRVAELKRIPFYFSKVSPKWIHRIQNLFKNHHKPLKISNLKTT